MDAREIARRVVSQMVQGPTTDKEARRADDPERLMMLVHDGDRGALAEWAHMVGRGQLSTTSEEVLKLVQNSGWDGQTTEILSRKLPENILKSVWDNTLNSAGLALYDAAARILSKATGLEARSVAERERGGRQMVVAIADAPSGDYDLIATFWLSLEGRTPTLSVTYGVGDRGWTNAAQHVVRGGEMVISPDDMFGPSVRQALETAGRDGRSRLVRALRKALTGHLARRASEMADLDPDGEERVEREEFDKRDIHPQPDKEASLFDAVVRLAHSKPEFQDQLLPILKKARRLDNEFDRYRALREMERGQRDQGAWHPELIKKLQRATGKPISVGEVIDNGRIRARRLADWVKVHDLTNAGKRGKKVDYFNLGSQSHLDDLAKAILDYVSSSLHTADYQQALRVAKSVLGLSYRLELDERSIKGVRVDPSGMDPVEIVGPKVKVRAEPQSFSVKDMTDRTNEPTAIPRKRKRTSTKKFYQWARQNESRIPKMSFNDVLNEMEKMGIDYHYYLAVD